MGWSNEERETCAVFDYIDKEWKIYTNVQRHYTKFKKCGYQLVKEEFDSGGVLIDAFFKCPGKMISFRSLISSPEGNQKGAHLKEYWRKQKELQEST